MSLADQLDLLLLPEMRACKDRRALEAAIRRRCHTLQVDGETTLCRILGRYKFFVDSRDASLAPHLMLDGYWEFWITDVIWNNVRPGAVCLDVGANLGYYSVLMAELAGPKGRLIAFEPNRRMAHLLHRNLEINGFLGMAEVSRRAVGATSGQKLAFQASLEHPKNGTLLSAPHAVLAHETLGAATEVETVALDDYAGTPVDFIKIDVEGAEEQVWHGMQRLLDASPNVRVLLEFNAARCAHPVELLAHILRRFPLRQVDDDAVIRPSDQAALLNQREDTMLYLSRLDPVQRGA